MKKIIPPTTKMSLLALAIGMNSAMGAYAAESLETIVVTAGKIEQDVQQTALSIQSISDEKLAQAGIQSLADVAKFTPGLQLEQTGGGLTATVRIRGIGTSGFSVLDPSVPIFIDGVAQSRNGAGFQDLLDVARVEVLRGPQGTLYGRNSTAGAINVWTKDASTRSWEGSVQGQIGNFNDREFKGTINIPMVENLLGGRFSLYSTDRDGDIENVMTGDSGSNYADRAGGRSKITLTPMDDLSITWIIDYSKSVTHPTSQVVAYPARFRTYAAGGIASNPQLSNTELQGNLPVPDPYSGRNYASYGWNEDRNTATSVIVNWDITEGFLADHSFTSLSAYQDYKNTQDSDRDSTVLEWQRTIGEAKTRSWSQEFRISSDASEKWEYVAGLFYYGQLTKSDQETNTLYTDAIAALNRGVFGTDPRRASISNSFSHTSQRQDNAALFGQATYAISDEFSLTAGLRGSWVRNRASTNVDVLARAYNVPGVTARSLVLIPHATSQLERDLSGVLKARYFIDESVMLYASYDRGFKPGGFNRLIGGGGGPATYTKENSNNFEIGAKTQWFDNRLQANIAAFYMDFEDYHNQVTAPNGNVIVENLKSVTTEGVEIDLQALLGSGFTTGLSLTYLNPRVNDDKIGNGQSTDATRPGQSQNLRNGQLINDVSQYSGNLFGEYAYPIGAAEGFVRTDLSYRSSFQLGRQGLIGTSNYSELVQGGYTTVNLRAGVRKLDEHWQLTGWVKNLTDKEYASTGGIGIGGQNDGLNITPGSPRTYGVTVQYDY